MQQLKATGYSALLLLLLCLSSTNGFLEVNRRHLEERNKNDQLNNRNFFGNTWQRSSEIKEERRNVPDFRRSTDDRDVRSTPIGDYRRHTRDSRLFSAISPADSRRTTNYREDRRLSPLETSDMRQEARLFENRRSAYSRRQISVDREDNLNRRREIRSISLNREQSNRLSSIDNSRRQTREEERRTSAARKDNSRRHFREQERRTSGNDRNSRQREIRSSSVGRSREDNSRQVREDTRERRNTDASSRHQNRRISLARETDRQSRHLDNSRSNIREEATREDTIRRGIRSRSVDKLRENSSRQLDLDRHHDSREDNSRRILATRDDDRQSRKQFQENNRRISLQRREIRSSSLGRPREDNSRLLITRDRQFRQSDTSRQQFRQDNSVNNRREIRVYSIERSREHDSRLVGRVTDNSRRISVAREDRQSRQLDNSRTQERRLAPERREIRLFALDRSREGRRYTVREDRTIDNSRRGLADREAKRQPRQLEDSRKISFERREIRLTSLGRTRDNSSLNNRESRRIAVQRREIRSSSLDRFREDVSREVRESRDRQSKMTDNSRRVVKNERRNREYDNSRRQFRLSDQEIRVLDRRLTKEVDRNSRVASLRRQVSALSPDYRSKRDSPLVSDATRRITPLHLSSKDENNNDRRFDIFERDSRQSRIAERRMATSFKPIENIEYIPEMKSNMLLNAAKVVLISLLIAQIASNSSKTKKNWFHNLTNFVTVTKEKVL